MFDSLNIKTTDEPINEFTASDGSGNTTTTAPGPTTRAPELANLTPLVFSAGDRQPERQRLFQIGQSFLFFHDRKAFLLYTQKYELFQWRELSQVEAQQLCVDLPELVLEFLLQTNLFPIFPGNDAGLLSLKATAGDGNEI